MDSLYFILWTYPDRDRKGAPQHSLPRRPSGVLRLCLVVVLISALVATLDVAARRGSIDLAAATVHSATGGEN